MFLGDNMKYKNIGAPRKIAPKIIDIFSGTTIPNVTGCFYVLDEFSDIWAWGYNPAGSNVLQGSSNKLQKVPTGAWKSIAATGNSEAAVVLDSSNRAFSFGRNNSYGVLGNNTVDTNLYISSPVSVVGGRFFDVVCNGSNYFIAKDTSGYLWSWGYNGTGCIGDNTGSSRSSPVSVVGGRKCLQLACTADANIMIDISSYAWAWGANTRGALGDGTLLNRSSPVSVLGGTKWGKIVGGSTTFIGLDISSELWSWGSTASVYSLGILGDGTNNVISNSPNKIPSAIGKKWIDIFSHSSSGSCFALDESSTLWGWGSGLFGSLNSANEPIPFDIQNVKKVAPHTNGGLILTNTDDVYVWSTDSRCFIGDGTEKLSSNPVLLKNINRDLLPLNYSTDPSKFKFINYAGVGMIKDASNNLWMWGSSANRQVLDYIETYQPFLPLGTKKYIDMELGSYYTFACDESSIWWGWGSNANRILNVGSALTMVSSPMSMASSTRFKKVYAKNGDYFALGLDFGGSLFSWGNNIYGQLGINNTTNQLQPVKVNGSQMFTDVALGTGHVIALDTSGYLWSWGLNWQGQLGDGTVTYRSVPVSVIGGRKYIKVAAYGTSSYAIDESSYAWSFGGNSGLLGDNTIDNRSSPVSIVGGRKFTNIETGGGVFLWDGFPTTNGIWSLSTNSLDLGDGTAINKSSPVSVLSSNNFYHFGAGNTKLAFSDSSVWMWGSGGNVGMTWAASRSPVAVKRIADIADFTETYTLTNIFNL
jgi:alpha-tubulin suppressor-like RCC1 family protein